MATPVVGTFMVCVGLLIVTVCSGLMMVIVGIPFCVRPFVLTVWLTGGSIIVCSGLVIVTVMLVPGIVALYVILGSTMLSLLL